MAVRLEEAIFNDYTNEYEANEFSGGIDLARLPERGDYYPYQINVVMINAEEL